MYLDLFDVLDLLIRLDLFIFTNIQPATPNQDKARFWYCTSVHLYLHIKFLVVEILLLPLFHSYLYFPNILSLHDSQISGETIHCCNTYSGILTPQGDVYVWGRGAKVSDCTRVDTAAAVP